MNIVYLLLGSNIGNKKENFSTAIDAIKAKIGVVAIYSKVYETSPWGVLDQPVFYNQVLRVESIHTATSILEKALSIELEMGRIRVLKWGERIIDIDILYYNDSIIDDINLKIPHRALHERKFTLIPLCEIAPDHQHPTFKLSNKQLLEACNDTGSVNEISI